MSIQQHTLKSKHILPQKKICTAFSIAKLGSPKRTEKSVRKDTDSEPK